MADRGATALRDDKNGVKGLSVSHDLFSCYRKPANRETRASSAGSLVLNRFRRFKAGFWQSGFCDMTEPAKRPVPD